MNPVQATAYVPGRARGVLRFGAAAAGPQVLSVLTSDEIARLRTPAGGIVALDAAPLSHVMIRLLHAGIPTVILDRGRAAELQQGEEAVLDGTTGLISDPAAALPNDIARSEPPTSGIPVATPDGIRIRLCASVAGAESAARALKCGATAIGLVRSEYLAPPQGRAPDTAFWIQAFSGLCQAAAPLPVTVRLMDIAADKRPAWLPELPGSLSALGLQGSRLFDREPVRGVVRAQAQALGQLASRFELSVLIPFITNTGEFLRYRSDVLEESATPIPVGPMAETPAAVLALPELAATADFVAIGCNDLLQCLFAADRDLPAVAPLVDPYAPAVFRFLRLAARETGDLLERVRLCGLLAQLPGVLPVLIGLGFRAFSVEPLLIPGLARTVASTSTRSAQARAHEVCSAGDANAVRRLLGLTSEGPWALGTSAI